MKPVSKANLKQGPSAIYQILAQTGCPCQPPSMLKARTCFVSTYLGPQHIIPQSNCPKNPPSHAHATRRAALLKPSAQLVKRWLEAECKRRCIAAQRSITARSSTQTDDIVHVGAITCESEKGRCVRAATRGIAVAGLAVDLEAAAAALLARPGVCERTSRSSPRACCIRLCRLGDCGNFARYRQNVVFFRNPLLR